MKKIFIILAFLITGFGADAAGPQPRDRAQSNTSQSNAVTSGAQTARAARSRSAARTPVAPVPASSTPSTPGVSTRKTQTIVSTQALGRSAATPVVTSRAAKQSVISTGTKVAAAAQNTVVDEKCWNGFMGCMDSFCMLDNANGGRCICSDKNAEYDSILAEIQSLDEQSYQMATVGVERIEMGDDANAVMKKTQEITKSIEKDSAQSKRKTLDLSAWDVNEIDFDAEVEDIFSLSSDGTGITNKTGDALYRAAAKLCNAQIPECKSQSTMMELMYKQRVRSDCTAYENSLRQQRTQSAQKLATAQSAMREAALEQYRNANKYDLGQCTVQFKQCMQTTGGCGDDFSGCVEYSVRQDLVNGGTDRNEKTIKGTSSKIKLSKATYDVLEAKKELCMSVTQQCVNVRDQVWDTFLREVAPQVKSAELMVESNMRSSCISNISTCFQKACKDNMDPNDPDGSYDMCLTNPDALEGACKVEIDPCKKSVPNIMTYVTARLASMRVDSCTREFKECLTSEDRCGADYTQCVGLDTDTIVEMCPVDKLPGCKYEADNKDYVYPGKQEDVRANLEKIATGIFLNIDNNMLSTCQKALDTAMLRVCGSTENCDDIVVDNGAGTRSFKYQVCEYKGFTGGNTVSSLNNSGVASANHVSGRTPQWTGVCYDSLDGISEKQLAHDDKNAGWAGKLSGLMYWGEISYEEYKEKQTDKQTKFRFTPIDKYMDNVAKATMGQNKNRNNLDEETKEIIRDRVYGMEIKALTSAVENAINAIESDQTVQYCMTGREFQGMNNKMLGGRSKTNPRFPNLTRQIRQMIANSALKNARDNYMEKYDEEMERMMKDQVKAAQRLDLEQARQIALQTCKDWAQSSALPASATPEADNGGAWTAVAGLFIAAVGVVAAVFTLGASTPIAIAGITMAAGALGGAAYIASNMDPIAEAGEGNNTGEVVNYIGTAKVEQWNYKASITTTPNYQTGECTKETISQNCAKERKNDCEEWGEEKTYIQTIKLLN